MKLESFANIYLRVLIRVYFVNVQNEIYWFSCLTIEWHIRLKLRKTL